MARRINDRSCRRQARRSADKGLRASRSRIAGAWVAMMLIASLMLAGCLSHWWWGIEVTGENGRVRLLESGGYGGSPKLHDLPASIEHAMYVGETLDGPSLIAAVPDCGYAFDAWGRGAGADDERDPFLWIEPAFLRHRSVEVEFTPSEEVRNDCFATPIDLTSIGPSGTVEFDNRRAGLEDGEPVHARTACEEDAFTDLPMEHYCGAGASLWWTFVAPSDGTLFLDVASDFQSVVAVYQGSNLESLDLVTDCLTEVGCDVPVAEGDALRIAVDGFGSGCIGCPPSMVAIGPVGSGTLHWLFAPSADAAAGPP